MESFRRLRLAGYGLALAALGVAAPAAGLPVLLSQADPVADEAAARAFLSISPAALPRPAEPLLGYGWTPEAAAPALVGSFRVDHGRILMVHLRTERRTEIR